MPSIAACASICASNAGNILKLTTVVFGTFTFLNLIYKRIDNHAIQLAHHIAKQIFEWLGRDSSICFIFLRNGIGGGDTEFGANTPLRDFE